MQPTDAVLFELAERLGRRLLAARCHLVTAESCTGGWIAKVVTDVSGSSQWFERGYAVYSNAAKVHDLGVSQDTLQRHGAVSEPVVREMAVGALRVSGADVAVSVSGIAGPDGGTPQKPVGTVWLGVAARRGSPVEVAVQTVTVEMAAAQMVPGQMLAAEMAAAHTVTAEMHVFPGDRESVRRLTVARALQLVLGLELPAV